MSNTISPYDIKMYNNVLSYKTKEEWMENRVSGIGGSEISIIMGNNSWTTPLVLWERKIKKGYYKKEEQQKNKFMQYGIDYEPILRKGFEIDFEDRYEVFYLDNTTLQHKEIPYFLYSPDGLLYDKVTGQYGILEIKTATLMLTYKKESWKPVYDENTKKWYQQIPPNYFDQMCWGLGISPMFEFVVMKALLTSEYATDEEHGQKQLKQTIIVERIDKKDNEEYIKELQTQGIKWWKSYVEKNEQPPVVISF